MANTDTEKQILKELGEIRSSLMSLATESTKTATLVSVVKPDMERIWRKVTATNDCVQRQEVEMKLLDENVGRISKLGAKLSSEVEALKTSKAKRLVRDGSLATVGGGLAVIFKLLGESIK